MKKVCLIIPVYNGMPHLRATLEAALNQDYANYEVLVTDDGSTDGSLEYIESIADSRLRVVNGPGKGLAHNMNAAVHHTDADYIARCDQDDVCDPKRISTQIALFMDGMHLALFSYITKFSKKAQWSNAERQKKTEEAIIPIHSLRDGAFLHSTLMIERQAFIDSQGYRQSCYPCDDWDLQLRLEEMAQQRGQSIGLVPQSLLAYRMHAAANTHNLFFEMQNKKRWIENNALRRRRGIPELSFIGYTLQEKRRVMKNINRKRKDLYHYHFRLAGESYLNRRIFALAYHTLCSSLYAPERLFRRIGSMVGGVS